MHVDGEWIGHVVMENHWEEGLQCIKKLMKEKLKYSEIF